METKLFLFICIAVLLIGYYIFVLYLTLQKKQKLDKSADARELYVRSKAPYLLLFGNLFKSNKKTNYKILKEEHLKDPHNDDVNY